MEEDHLTEVEGQFLIHLARTAIRSALLGSNEDPLDRPATSSIQRLDAPGASFVTLHTRAEALRGCIGSLIARRPLVEDVQANAIAAAFEDPRFPPVALSELPNLVIEVSVLSLPRRLDYNTPEDLINKLRPNVDGVVIERGWHRATFLPQVWEQLPRPEDFLTNLCYKAGLGAKAWQEVDIVVSTYSVQKFTENP